MINWSKFEDIILNEYKDSYIVKNATLKEQYKDVDLIIDNKKFSIKLQNKTSETDNISFETKLYSDNGQIIPGNFTYSQSDYCIIGYIKNDTLHYHLWSTNLLKKIVPVLSHKTVRLTSKAKATNVGRKFTDSENLLVQKDKLIEYAIFSKSIAI
jgi:hypothetical protein